MGRRAYGIIQPTHSWPCRGRPYQRTSLCEVLGWIILVDRCSQAGVAVPKHTLGLRRPALRDNLGYYEQKPVEVRCVGHSELEKESAIGNYSLNLSESKPYFLNSAIDKRREGWPRWRIITSSRPGQPRDRSSIPGIDKRFLTSPKRPEGFCGPLSSLLKGYRGSFFEGKVDGAWSLTFTPPRYRS